MSKFIVAIFANESKAYTGTKALKELQEEGSLEVYGMAVIAKGSDGRLSVKDGVDEGPLGMAVGGLVGGLVGLIGGPAGAAAGLAGGALLGSWGDLVNLGISEDFVDHVSRELTPGKSAVIAEVDEYWTTPLDSRIEALGGVVLRQWRSDFEDDQIDREIRESQAELAELKAEHAQARADAKARLQTRIDNAQAKLKAASDRAKAKVEEIKQQNDAKIKTLQDRASKSKAETKAKIDERIAEIRADRERRTNKLKQASTLIKEAFGAHSG